MNGRFSEEPQTKVFNINAAIHAPFDGLDETELEDKVIAFIKESGLDDDQRYFLKAGFIAQGDDAFASDSADGPRGLFLTKEEQDCLIEEKTRRWKHPGALWRLVALCALGAAVQGWDEAAVDGAQIYYAWAFGIGVAPDMRDKHHEIIIGFVNAAPYLCCAFSCWLTQPLNSLLGRRGTIFLACIFSAAFCLGQSFAWSWQSMVAFRFLLGLGIGPKSATIPIYASECAPANVRGALVMMWQVFTAFGIMCGFFVGPALRSVLKGQDNLICPYGDVNADTSKLLSTTCSLNWRLMIGSPMIAPIILAMYIYTQPESPRWLLAKAHKATHLGNIAKSKEYYARVFQSLTSLRHSKLQAARDMMLIHFRLRKEEDLRAANQTSWYKRGIWELFAKPRNRRAVIASLITMFFQQFCGINVLIYYSSTVLEHARYTAQTALLYSMGIGIINFTCALPAFYTIDTFGRRNLLLVTFPFLALFQLFNAISFKLKGSAQTGLIIAGMYLFSIAYSPGEGPVPFVYSAESMPLYIRDLGMGLVTSINWLFNFTIAITLPSYLDSFTGFGTFLWYFAWCIIGWFLIFTLVPETRSLELEELDAVFETSTYTSARFYWRQGEWAVRNHILRQKGRQKPILQVGRLGKKEMELRPMRRRTTIHTEASC